MLCHWGFPVDRTTDAASTPTYKEKQMAIGAIQGAGGLYDANRDMFFVSASQAAYERDMHERKMYAARQEEEYRKMQNSCYADAKTLQQQQVWIGDSSKPKSKPELNDPLSFLSKADRKILLTGELA
jgi:hypothetical protein